MNKEQITVVLVDDHPVVMEGLRALLNKNKRIHIKGEFTTGEETLHFFEKKCADVVLLDITLPDIGGTDLCLKIKERCPQTKMLVISNHNERSMITNMLGRGVSGYLLKNSSSKELFRSIEDVIKGRLALSEEVKDILARGEVSRQSQPKLTRRETEVLKLVAEGMTTDNIAEKLFISPLTVETHRRNMMQKFDVNNAAALIKVAMEQNVI